MPKVLKYGQKNLNPKCQNFTDRAEEDYCQLCLKKDKKGNSMCKSGDVDELANIVRKGYLDPPSKRYYNFSNNPPALEGQIGVPSAVDEILGKYLRFGNVNGVSNRNGKFFIIPNI